MGLLNISLGIGFFWNGCGNLNLRRNFLPWRGNSGWRSSFLWFTRRLLEAFLLRGCHSEKICGGRRRLGCWWHTGWFVVVRSLRTGFLACRGALAFSRRKNLYHVAANLNAPIGFVNTNDMSNLRNFWIAFAAENSTANRMKNGEQNGHQKEKTCNCHSQETFWHRQWR